MISVFEIETVKKDVATGCKRQNNFMAASRVLLIPSLRFGKVRVFIRSSNVFRLTFVTHVLFLGTKVRAHFCPLFQETKKQKKFNAQGGWLHLVGAK